MISNKYFLKDFIVNFSKFKDQSIILYGTGEYTKIILSANELKDFKFVALVDPRFTGSQIFNYPVIEIDEADKLGTMIIIVANLSISQLIYDRIKIKLGNRLRIFFLNGIEQKEYIKDISKNVYWEKSWIDLEEKAQRYDVISFDIFDTLCMRKCLYASNVFSLVEKYARKKYGFAGDFFGVRKKAEKYCSKNVSKYFTLDMIYNYIQKMFKLSDDIRNDLREKELLIEQDMIIARKAVVSFMNKMKKTGKKVILVSDMYLQEDEIKNLLKKMNIVGFDNIYISSSCKKNKYNGEMYRYLRNCYPNESVLHIGDNYAVDVEMAILNGIDTYHIKSAIDMMKISGWSDKFEELKTIEEELIMGLFLAKYFNDPFLSHKYRGKKFFDSMNEIGYLFWGPVVLYYMAWLIEKIEDLNIDTLLFISRDAFILKKIYHIMESYIPKKTTVIYFFTSRRAASLAAIETVDDIYFVVNYMMNVNSISFEDVLWRAFHVKADAADIFRGLSLREIGKENLFQHIIENYAEMIFIRAKKERSNYITYINSLKIEHNTNVGFINFIGRGVSQFWVKKILEKLYKVNLYGLYFSSEAQLRDVYPEPDMVHAAFGKDTSIHTSKLNLVGHCIEGEVVFTAPMGTVKGFNKDGIPQFGKDCNQSIDHINECHDGICEFVQEFLKIYGVPKYETLNKIYIDNLYSLFYKPFVELSNDIRQVFSFSDQYGQAGNIFAEKKGDKL